MKLLEEDRKQLLINSATDITRTRTIIEEWKKHGTYLASMLSHHETEDLEIGMMLLQNYANEKQYDEYLETVNECINKLKHVRETQAPDVSNIF